MKYNMGIVALPSPGGFPINMGEIIGLIIFNPPFTINNSNTNVKRGLIITFSYYILSIELSTTSYPNIAAISILTILCNMNPAAIIYTTHAKEFKKGSPKSSTS